MREIEKLIEYAEISGHEIYIKDSQLFVRNGKNLPYQLKRLIKVMRDDIYHYMTEGAI